MQGPEAGLPILTGGEDTVSVFLHPPACKTPLSWPLCTFNLHFAAGCFQADEVSSLPLALHKKKVKEEKQPDVKGFRGLRGERGGGDGE